MREVRANGGFALVEAGALALTLVLIAFILLVTGQRSRGNAQQAGSIANLHEFAAVTASYHADYSDQFWSFSWGVSDRGTTMSPLPESNQALASMTEPIATAAVQAVDIARRRGDTNMPFVGLAGGWYPWQMCGHWVLSDYLEQPLALRFAVSPGDANRVKWSNDPAGFLSGAYHGGAGWPDFGNPVNRRLIYSSSYRMGPAFFAKDYSTTSGPAPQPIATIQQGANTGQFRLSLGQNPNRLGGRLSSEVAYPSQKVFMFDVAQWSGVKQSLHWLDDRARIPMLFVDGSAHIRVAGKANPGSNPANPSVSFPYLVTYEPLNWEAPGVAGTYTAKFYFTRGGLKGRDYDGSEAVGPPY